MTKMVSYKDWKLINEAIGGSMTLGVSQTNNLGVIGSVTQDGDQLFDEMKKRMKSKMSKMKKKMSGDMDDEEIVSDVDDEDAEDAETGDGEVVDVEKASPKDKNVNADKLAAADSEDGEEDVDVDDEDGEEEEEESKISPMMMKKGMKKKMKKKMKKEDIEGSPLDADWWDSLNSMVALPKSKNWDGTTIETAKSLDGPQPGPGQPGYAPQTRIGNV